MATQDNIHNVAVIDDEPAARRALKFSVEDGHWKSVPILGPLKALNLVVRKTRASADAVVCDHHLRKHNYATFNGAVLVKAFYLKKTPAILCTKFALASVEEIRGLRRFVPVLLNPDEISPDTMHDGFEQCRMEFAGQFVPERRPRRALVRLEDLRDLRVYVTVPSWDPAKVIALLRTDVPAGVLNLFRKGQNRVHALVNMGAQSYEDVFIDWRQVEP